MPEDQKNTDIFETKGVPTIYCNQANVSLSYNDVRLYIGEVSPKELVVTQGGKEFAQKEPLYEPRCCLVVSPEFARSLAKAITAATEKYEGLFGPLRPEPTPAKAADISPSQ
jgi:hypothetical protein